MAEKFPIDLSQYQKLAINPWKQNVLTAEQRTALAENVLLCRDAIVCFTASGGIRGYGGHTGGPYDTVPEVMILDSLFRGCPDQFVPIFFDESGHRVATQYLFSVLEGHMPADHLLQYRVGHSKLPGHPELGLTPGIKFSSGRLAHLWPFCNGVCLANPEKIVCCLSSDGSMMEGNDAEAARLAVAQNLNIKLIVDDNNVTISGHPEDYLKGYDCVKTLEGHGMKVFEVKGEDLEDLYRAIRNCVMTKGPCAVVIRRKMMPGVAGVEGTTEGHDCIPGAKAITYLEGRGRKSAADCLRGIKKASEGYTYEGSTKDFSANRLVWGETMVSIMKGLTAEKRKDIIFFDCDLEGSTGMKAVHAAFPDRFIMGGVQERGCVSAAAGFGMAEGKQGVMATFSAFLEMIISEVTMARLNRSNLMCHFSHAGIDDMSDNTCHFGLNNLFADNGLEEGDTTRVYFPADKHQMKAVTETVYHDKGIRFIFSTRSKVPVILTEKGDKELFSAANGYKFVPGKDEIVREGTQGYIVTYGDEVYRCLDAVEKLRKQGISIGLINKPTLNVVDEDMLRKIGKAPFVLVAESMSRKTGLGARFGTWLLERGLTPKYCHLGTYREGCGGLWEHHYYQGIDPASIIKKVKELLSGTATA